METRKIPKTDLNLSAIAFGSFASGGWAPSEKKAATEAIRASYQMGITPFDTAPTYGLGETETVIGEALKPFPRDKIQIMTKFGLRWIYQKGTYFRSFINFDGKKVDIYRYASKESVIEECENSLKRLNMDYIDLYQLHWPDETTPMEETFEGIQRLVEQGKGRYVGVSNLTPEQLDKVEHTFPVVSIQMPYNMLDRKIEEEIIPYCIEHDTALIAYRPLGAGLLTGKMSPDIDFSRHDTRRGHPNFTPENIRKANKFVDSLRPIAQANKVSVPQLVLSWTLNRPGITCVLTGAMNSAQAIENAKAANIKLSKKDTNAINTALLESGF